MFKTQGGTRNQTRDLPKKGSAFITSPCVQRITTEKRLIYPTHTHISPCDTDFGKTATAGFFRTNQVKVGPCTKIALFK